MSTANKPDFPFIRKLFSPMLVLRYGVVGLLNTLFGAAVFYALLWLGLVYWQAAALALIIGMTYNFFTYRTFVFSSNSGSYFVRYISIQLGLYAVNIAVQQQLARHGFNDRECFFILFGPYVIVNYILTRWLAFPPVTTAESR